MNPRFVCENWYPIENSLLGTFELEQNIVYARRQ